MISTASVHLDELKPKARSTLTQVAARRRVTVAALMAMVLETYADTWEDELKGRKAS